MKRPLLPAALLAAGLALLVPARSLRAQAPDVKAPLVQLFASDSVNLTNVGAATFSPDQRWIAFSRGHSEKSASLWVVRADGGNPVRLTSGDGWDGHPSFSRSGDRVYFMSNRPDRTGTGQDYGMVVGFDPKTGRAVGAPRQVTVDPVTYPGVRISPDGKWIAYGMRKEGVVKVIPAAGGAARTVAPMVNVPMGLTWSADSRSLYYAMPKGTPPRQTIVRASLSGGEPVEVAAVKPDGNLRTIVPDGGYYVSVFTEPGRQDRYFVVNAFDGRTLARIPVRREMVPTLLPPDPKTLLVSQTNVVAPIRTVSTGGERGRPLTGGTEYDWPTGWTADGSAALIESVYQGRNVMMVVPLKGGQARSLDLPAQAGGARWVWVGPGRYAVVMGNPQPLDERKVIAVELETGRAQTLAENVRGVGVGHGPGGVYGSVGDEILYTKKNGEQVELRAVRPGGSDRLVRPFPDGFFARGAAAVNGNRVAWSDASGDSVRIFVAEGATGRPRAIFSAPKPRGPTGVGELAWSYDGRFIATHMPGDEADPLVIVEVPNEGEPVRPPRVIPTGFVYWYQPRWLPDNSGVVILAGGQGVETHLLLFPMQPGKQPVNLTREDPSPKWGYEISPDGQWVIYPAEVSRGSSFWKMDLSQVVAGAAKR